MGWEWVNIAYLLGGLILLKLRIIRWHIPMAMLAGLVFTAFLAQLFAPGTTASPMIHLLSGATMLGAFFIATDPVSGCVSDRGRLIFGAGVGIITLVIPRWGGYPDGVAFAVLLMNMAAVLIDRYTRPRMYGE